MRTRRRGALGGTLTSTSPRRHPPPPPSPAWLRRRSTKQLLWRRCRSRSRTRAAPLNVRTSTTRRRCSEGLATPLMAVMDRGGGTTRRARGRSRGMLISTSSSSYVRVISCSCWMRDEVFIILYFGFLFLSFFLSFFLLLYFN